MNTSLKTWLKKTIVFLVVAAMAIALLPFAGLKIITKAELNPDGSPKHDKTIDANGDGTYKIELSVTGDADTEVQTAANVNVLIVYDES